MATLKKVKCLYCGKLIDRENEQFIKVKNRYAHFSCYESKYKEEQKEKEERKKLTDLIKELYAPDKPNWDLITAQIKKYKGEGMTYMGMYYTLTFFFVIEKNDIRKGKGVGIIPYKYETARKYYERSNNIYTKAAKAQDIKVKQTENIITITQTKPKKKLIDFDY